MPEPSGEPPPSSQEHPGGSRPLAPAGGPSHLSPAPRAHPASVHQPKATSDVPPPPPGTRAVLEWLRRYGNLDLDRDEPILTEVGDDLRSTQSRLSKEQRKFHKFDPEHPHPTLTATAGTASSRADYASESARMDAGLPDGDHPRGITAEQLAYIRRRRADISERRLWIALGVAVAAFLAVAAAFVMSHSAWWKTSAVSAESAPAAQKVSAANVPGVLTPEVMDLLDQAMLAEASSDYAKAIELLGRAQHDAGHIYGTNYRLASLCYQANEMTQVVPLLNLSISEGEETAACYSLLGTLLNRSEGTPQEPSDLEKATRLEPLNARFFFVWGETLRRDGKPQLALPQLQRAVARLQEPALADVYALKLRLTQIELGQENKFAAEMTAKLRDVPPPVDWLLTAAAVEMHRGNFPAAVEALDKVRALVGEHEMARQLQDVFFKPFARESELARFFDAPVSP